LHGVDIVAVITARMQFSRHARNRMRQYGITDTDVAAIIAAPVKTDADADGCPRFYGYIGTRIYRVVQPVGETDFVKSVHPRRTL
jgi:hypothetical protein